MAGYLDPKIKDDPRALDRPDDSSAFCLAQAAGVVLLLLLILFVVFLVGWTWSG